MARRAAKSSRSSGAAPVSSVTVVSGLIRGPDEVDALKVKLSIWDTEITMRADGAELGNWPTESVDMRPLDGTSYEFVAEGDLLIFTPDDPDEFGRHPMVAGGVKLPGGRKARRSKNQKAKTADNGQVELAWDQSSAEEERLVKKRAKGATAKAPKQRTSEAPKTKSAKPRRSERRAAAASYDAAVARTADPVVPDPIERAAPKQIVPEAIPTDTAAPEAVAPAPSPAVPREKKTREKVPRQKKTREKVPREKVARQPKIRKERTPVEDRYRRLKELRHQGWMFSLDKARQFDLFGLDRVPVNEALRGQEHQHTWDHRVAPSGGPGRYICTICGEIRRKA